ncbi:hypothetical protein AGOR_G00104490 [Albula goreensis]|uniref:DH domain-containing protein n=1 Tax=Albula goreensis TaxID=1534307 RepID=A0A8T3DFZ6_9TELE|nr:hypothetical protein AGOR_G00104490 [Albula goreensis]
MLALATPAPVPREEEIELFPGEYISKVVDMKPQEEQLISEISELQSMVSDLKVGFSGALLELSQIQNEDTRLREDLEQTKNHCDQQALQLQALVYSLKTELQEVRHQICQLWDGQQSPLRGGRGEASGSTQTHGSSCVCEASGRTQCDSMAPPLSHPGRVLLHCYLQGLRAGQHPGTDTLATIQDPPRLGGPPPFLTIPCDSNILQDSSFESKRQQVALDLFHSEREYLSTLFQLHDKYRMSALPKNHESCQTFVNHLEQLSQHSLLFRNALEDRLFCKRWQGLVGDVFAKLTCQNDCSFMDTYLGYLRTLPVVLSSSHQSNGIIHTTQGCPGEREELQQVSLLLAPVSRIHSYLSHIQNLLRWTNRDHPDHYLLQASERALRNFLCQCHAIVDQGSPQGDGGREDCSGSAGPPLRAPSPTCKRSAGSKALIPGLRRTVIVNEQNEPVSVTNRDQLDKDCHTANSCPALHQSGSCCPHPQGSERKSCSQDRIPDPPSPSHIIGNGCHRNSTFRLAATVTVGEEQVGGLGRAPPPREAVCDPGSRDHVVKGSSEDCDTDLDDLGDTSVFDYSSVTSCSPDGTLEMRERAAAAGTGDRWGNPKEGSLTDDEEEEDSQVPVLLKPTGILTQSELGAMPKDSSVFLRVQIPRATPHPPPGKPRIPNTGQPTLGPGARNKNEENTSLKTSPSQHPPTRPFRQVCPAPIEQGNTTQPNGNSMSHGTVENPGKQCDPRGPLDRSGLRSVLGVAFYRPRCSYPRGKETNNTGMWEDSEDSDGPCSTV